MAKKKKLESQKIDGKLGEDICNIYDKGLITVVCFTIYKPGNRTLHCTLHFHHLTI